MALSDYSSHDWRKFTDDAVVVDHKTKMKVNESRVIFTNPKTLKEESDVDVALNLEAESKIGK